MKLTIIGHTVETAKTDGFDMQEAKKFCGKGAAICYMKEPYFNSYVSADEGAENRYNRVIGTGHTSIADSVFINVLFENCSKMQAMILDVMIRFYSALEKSGRYTVIGDTPTYKKWVGVYTDLIQKANPDMDSKLVDKLALENARYVLNVFAKTTTMEYVTTLRNWTNIYYMCLDYMRYNSGKAESGINYYLYREIQDIANSILEAGLVDDKIPNKFPEGITFLADQSGYTIDDSNVTYGTVFFTPFVCSFVTLAQLIRHRTLDYYICTDDEYGFYVPEIIRDTQYKQVWIDDLCELMEEEGYFPNALRYKCYMYGSITNFTRLCTDRLCARVQKETFDVVKSIMQDITDSRNNLPDFAKLQLEPYYNFDTNEVKMKCTRIKCTEPCYWGGEKGKTRNI